MDVEKNPGLDENFMTVMKNIDWRFAEIMHGIKICIQHTSTARWMRSLEA